MKWKEAARSIDWDIHPFIDGRLRPSQAKEFFDNVDPATEATLCRVAAGHSADVDEAVRVARHRFEDGCWSELPPARRGEVLLKLADLIVQHKADLALLDTLEMGKPIQAALHDAQEYAPSLLRSWAGFADKIFGASAPSNRSTVSFNTYEPRGVVGAITPWNFPIVNAVIKIGPALAAGNSVVLKPSELSASSALKLADLALEAGVPSGVLNVEEIFGPVLCVQSFKTDVEAINLANGTEFGLAATVWTRDMARAKHMAHAIKAGSIYVRTSGAEAAPSGCSLSYEPRKASGFGAELGLNGLQSYSTLKSVHFVGA